jgi:hypothetical protein
MKNAFYQFQKTDYTQYVFTSTGKRNIDKIVEFSPTTINGIINLGFGDLSEDGTIDDEVNSNNGDIRKVITTVINIIQDFTLENNNVKIFFRGSTPERTFLYARILKTYYDDFSVDFHISGITADTSIEEPFNPSSPYNYKAFFIQRIA